ncbi:MAG: HEAT repeat domain-containing protein [Phycisphaerae bacterium]|nr:HEAT repeat domain-containing protein [Phycisphaerae bacterium]
MKINHTFCVATCLAALFAAGCERDTTHTFRGDLAKSFNKPTPEQYLAMTASPNPDERREGLIGLAKSPRASEALALYAAVAGNEAEEVPVRAVALGVLGQSRDAAHLPVIVTCLDNDSPRIRWEAATALDNLPGEAAVGPLRRRTIADEAANVRAACATALRHYNRPDVLTTLARALNDPQFAVRNASHKSLKELTTLDLGYDPQPWLDHAAKTETP